jgi:hypothetical protein
MERVISTMKVSGLTELPVRITGEWHPYPKHWSWGGHVRADEALVAVLMCHYEDRLEWTRTEHHTDPDGLAVRLDYRPSGESADISLGMGPGRSLSWIRGRIEAVRADHPPPVERTASYQTGQIIDFATLPGAELVVLRLLLVARRDVHSKRVGLWSLRREVAMNVEEPWREVLSSGRTGVTHHVAGFA